MHVRNLPLGSATTAALKGGQQYRGWTQDRYMLADIYDAIRDVAYTIVLANADPKKRTPPEPEPWPRPKVNTKKVDKPGSFGFMTKMLLAKAKARKAKEKAGK